MTYFNGSFGFTNISTGRWTPGVKTDRIYCDDCAEAAIPLPTREQYAAAHPGMSPGGRHHDTGFKWAPYYGGDAVCMVCGVKA